MINSNLNGDAQVTQLPTTETGASEALGALTPGEVAALVAGSSCKSLSPTEYARALPALTLAVQLAQPKDDMAAKRFLSDFANFVADSGRWDRVSSPALERLLKEDAIAAHGQVLIEQGASNSKSSKRAVSLNRILRGLNGQPVDGNAARTAAAGERAVALQEKGHDDRATAPTGETICRFPRRAHGSPAADGPEGGARLSDAELRQLVRLPIATSTVLRRLRSLPLAVGEDRLDRAAAAALAELAPCGADPTPSNLWALASARALAVAPSEVITHARPSKTKPAKAPSRAALLRAAEAELQQGGEHALMFDYAIPLAQPEDMSVEVWRAICEYAPGVRSRVDRADFDLVAEQLRRLLAAAGPDHPGQVRRAGHFLLRFLIFRARSSGSAPPDFGPDLWSEELREQYRQHLDDEGVPVSSQGTALSEVSRVLRAARTAGPRAAPPTRDIAPPCVEAEVNVLIRLARNQPTLSLRCQMAATVALAAGAGLNGPDQRPVRYCDVERVTLHNGSTVLVVHVREPATTRAVPVLRLLQPLLEEALVLHKQLRKRDDALLLGVKPDRRNITAPLKERASKADGSAVDFDVNRLRKFWLATQMTAAVPLPVLLQAAGLRSTRALTDLLPFLPTPPPEQALTLLRDSPPFEAAA